MQLNEITFAGFAGKDAVSNTTQSGTTYTVFSLCHTYKGKDKKETSTWIQVSGFGNVAEWMIAIRKGDNVIVNGSLSVRNYTDKEGKERTSVGVVAQTFGILQKPQAKSDNAAPSLDEIPF